METPRMNLLDHDSEALAALLTEHGERGYRATQFIKWVHQQGVTDFSAMTNLSKSLRQRLASNARLDPPEVVVDLRIRFRRDSAGMRGAVGNKALSFSRKTKKGSN